MNLLLTDEEIESLTGCKRVSDQEAALRAEGIPVFHKRGGKISVVRAWLEQAPFAKRAGDVVEIPKVSAPPKMGNIGKKRG